jgi:hypothetical protein
MNLAIVVLLHAGRNAVDAALYTLLPIMVFMMIVMRAGSKRWRRWRIAYCRIVGSQRLCGSSRDGAHERAISAGNLRTPPGNHTRVVSDGGLVAATATYWILGRRLSSKANQIGRCQDNPSVVVRAFVRRVMRSCLVIKTGLKDALDWAALAGRLHCAMLRCEKGYSNGYSRLTAPRVKQRSLLSMHERWRRPDALSTKGSAMGAKSQSGESTETGATGGPTNDRTQKPDPCASVVGFLSRVHMGPV